MRIVIDMQGAQTDSRFRGIGRYSLSLAQAIARNAGNHDVCLALNSQLPESISTIRQAFEHLIPEERIRIFDVPQFNTLGNWESRSAEAIREAFLVELNPDIVLVTSLFEGFWANAVLSVGAFGGGHRTAVVLYDLIPFIYPENYLRTSEMQNYYQQKLECMKRSGLVLAISESSRQEGIRLLGMSEDKVVNISSAIGGQFRPNIKIKDKAPELLSKFAIQRSMVLYAPGGFDTRKNFKRLMEAYSLLPESLRRNHQLVIVSKLNQGQHQEMTTMAKSLGLGEDELILTGYVSDDDLINLYSLARLFIFPSLHEGFGLPALEAMACGVPVVGSMTTSLPEVIGLKEALFDPESVESIQQTLAQGLTDEAYRQRLIEHAKVHVKKFNWDNTAKTALEALEKLHAIAPFLDEKPDLIEELSKIAKDTKPDTKALRLTANCIAYNQGAQQRQLLLDISTLVHTDAKTGTQRVVLSLISELFKLNPRELNIQPIYFTGGIYRYANAFCFENFLYETGTGDTPVDFFQGDVYLSLDLNMQLSHETHMLHCDMRSRGLRIAYLVYGILVSQYPKWWKDDNASIFLSWLKNIGDVATDLICISQSVATDVKSFYKQNPPNRSEQDPAIRSFHLGADLEKTLLSIGLPTSSGQMLSAMQERLSLLMVGTIEPRDDYLQALAVFELLWQRGLDINLVVVGMRGWLVDGCIDQLENHPQSMRKLFWLDSVNDEYLQIIYQAADCFIDASEGENFGLPVIKAVQNGLPLIVRDLPFFREIAPEYAHFFQGHSPNDLVDAIEQWVKLHAKNLHPTTTSMKWLSRKESAAQLISLMDLN